MQSNSRREFLLKTVQGSALTATAALGWFYLIQQQAQASPHAVRPPGAESRDEFYARCIKCGQCVQACPFDTLDLAEAGSYVPLGTPYFVPRQTPCYLCPLGAFYSLLGRRSARLVVSFDAARCTHCAECATVCPEPQVLNLKKLEQAGRVSPGECSACGRCVGSCPEGSLQFRWRYGRSLDRSNQSSRFSPGIIPQRRSS